MKRLINLTLGRVISRRHNISTYLKLLGLAAAIKVTDS